MAGLPNDLIENPPPTAAGARARHAGTRQRPPASPRVSAIASPARDTSALSTSAADVTQNSRDVLSDVLRTIRLSGALQFCFMPTGTWKTDDAPALAELISGDGASKAASSHTVPFHIVVEGSCWLKMDGLHVDLEEGDIVAFPFGSGHQLGAGEGGPTICPVRDLPPKPWRSLPILRYDDLRGDDGVARLRMLCGYLHCEAMNFRPLREALPPLLHLRCAESDRSSWLRAAIRQIALETDHPQSGGLSLLERLTEITFIEMLRQQIAATPHDAVGWLAALADPALGRCLALIHDDPRHEWSVQSLAAAAGLSRSTLAERFEAVLQTSPIRYLRDWRLYLASVALSTSSKPIAAIAYDSGYGTEAAFNRAFSRAYGLPPAAWRQMARSL